MATRQRKKKTDKKETKTMTDSPSKKNKNKNAKLNATLKERQKMTSFGPLFAVIILGIIFGFALNKGRVFEPQVIIDQFLFKRWIMMKMFLSAAATSTLSIIIASILLPAHFSMAKSGYNGCNNLIATMIGAGLLGCGMAIGGACPGMVLIQVGAGIQNSVITLIGGAIAALTYQLIEPFIRSLFAAKTVPYLFLEDYFKINRTTLAGIVAFILFSVTFVLETIFPWKSELSTKLDPNCNVFQCTSWNPIFAGIIVGLLQLPSIALLGKTLGSSSAYVCITSQWLRAMPESTQNFFAHGKGKLNSFYQAVYITAAIIGSMLAVVASGTMNVYDLMEKPFDGIGGNTKEKAFIGGFLMIFGARMAKGCTSGHGLSGMGLLCTASVIAVASMFLCGGIAAFVSN